MPKIFISYRREDTGKDAARLNDRLERAFHKTNIFRDVNDIIPGDKWQIKLADEVDKCDILLALIGPKWATIRDNKDSLRLFNDGDFVRFEIATALQRDKIVIPVLLDGTKLSVPNALPDDLQELLKCQAIELRPDPHFEKDVDDLIQILRSRSPKGCLDFIFTNSRGIVFVASALLLAAIVLAFVVALSGPGGARTPTFNDLVALTRTAVSLQGENVQATLDAIATETEQYFVDLTPGPTSTNTPDARLRPSYDLARRFSGGNQEWEPVVWTFDDDPTRTRMVLVPVGSVIVSSENNGQEGALLSNATIDRPFWMDETEVTRLQYQLCINAGECSETPPSDYSQEDHQPMNRVTWPQALEYCQWRKGQLPTEAQWEYAARGSDGWIYPWGNEWNDNYAVWNRGETAEVGSIPEGASWVGALDMSGNLWEWMLASPYTGFFADIGDYPDARMLRGGAFIDTVQNRLRTTERNFEGAATDGEGRIIEEGYAWGFRCARLP